MRDAAVHAVLCAPAAAAVAMVRAVDAAEHVDAERPVVDPVKPSYPHVGQARPRGRFRDAWGETLLHLAALRGDPAIVAAVIDHASSLPRDAFAAFLSARQHAGWADSARYRYARYRYRYDLSSDDDDKDLEESDEDGRRKPLLIDAADIASLHGRAACAAVLAAAREKAGLERAAASGAAIVQRSWECCTWPLQTGGYRDSWEEARGRYTRLLSEPGECCVWLAARLHTAEQPAAAPPPPADAAAVAAGARALVPGLRKIPRVVVEVGDPAALACVLPCVVVGRWVAASPASAPAASGRFRPVGAQRPCPHRKDEPRNWARHGPPPHDPTPDEDASDSPSRIIRRLGLSDPLGAIQRTARSTGAEVERLVLRLVADPAEVGVRVEGDTAVDAFAVSAGAVVCGDVGSAVCFAPAGWRRVRVTVRGRRRGAWDHAFGWSHRPPEGGPAQQGWDGEADPALSPAEERTADLVVRYLPGEGGGRGEAAVTVRQLAEAACCETGLSAARCWAGVRRADRRGSGGSPGRALPPDAPLADCGLPHCPELTIDAVDGDDDECGEVEC